MTKTRERELNFELLRCMAMILIVIGHCIYHGVRHITAGEPVDVGIDAGNTLDMMNFTATQSIGYLANVGVNVFVLITGYFMTKPRIVANVVNKAIRLWLQIVFWAVVIAVGCGIFTNAEELYLATFVMPIYNNVYWFLTMYMALLLLSPFLARLEGAITKHEYAALLLILLVLDFGMAGDTIGFARYFGGGMSLPHFIFLFLVGGYVKRYSPLQLLQRYAGWLYIALCLALAALSVAMQMRGLSADKFLYIKGEANNSFPLVTSLLLFLWAKNLRLSASRWSWLTRITPYVLGVYLIHDHKCLRPLLWDSVSAHIHEVWFVPYVLGISIAVFVVCLALDSIRAAIFRFLHIDKLKIMKE